MRNLNEDNVTDAVLQQIKVTDARFGQIMTSLVKHLHSFIRDVELTEAEWFAGIQFRTRVGQICDESRQEFILLSDTLGVSILADAINHRMPEGVTESTVLGPFHRNGAPVMEQGTNIAQGSMAETGTPVVARGRVTGSIRRASRRGDPRRVASIARWKIRYSETSNQADMNLRGIFRTDANGEYWFRTVKPSAYPIPDDGPVGDLLHATGRHPMRPAHIHFIIIMQGYERLVTHIFVEGDEYLDSDAVFGVKNSRIADFVLNESTEAAARYGFNAPFYEVEFNFGLKPV